MTKLSYEVAQLELLRKIAELENNGTDFTEAVETDIILFSNIVEAYAILAPKFDHTHYMNKRELVDNYVVANKERLLDDVLSFVDDLERIAYAINNYYSIDIVEAVFDELGYDETVEALTNETIRMYHECRDMAEVAEQYLHETDSLSHVALDGQYIDEAQLLHDLHCNSEVSEYYYHVAYEDALEEGKTEEEAQQIASDYEFTDEDEAQFLEMVLDSIVHDEEMLKRYFDYEAYGRDMEIDGHFIQFDYDTFLEIWS